QSKQTNIGLDIGVLNNRLTLNADYFVKRTDRMLMDIALAGTTGMQTKTVNGGRVTDKGIELAVTYSSKSDAAFQYDISASVNKISNNVDYLIDDFPRITSQVDYRGILKPLLTEPGQQLYSYYGLVTAGLFRSNQDGARYKKSVGTHIHPGVQPRDKKFVDQT